MSGCGQREHLHRHSGLGNQRDGALPMSVEEAFPAIVSTRKFCLLNVLLTCEN